MKSHIQYFLIALALFATVHLTRAANIIWTNTAGGNWSATNNWSPNQSPGTNDTATITNAGNYTVTLDVNAAVSGLLLGTPGGGSTQTILLNGYVFTLNGAAAVNAGGQFNLNGGIFVGNNGVLNGALNCSGDTFSGTFTIASNAVLNLGTATSTFDTYYAGIGILTNYGTINWSSGNINCDNGPVFDNYGLWNAQGNASLLGRQPSGTTTFNNFGTFRKSAGSGTNIIDAGTLFNTTGTVDVQSGTVSVNEGQGSGTVNVAGGTFISLGYNFILNGNTLFTGTGTVGGFLVGNNVVLSGTLNCSGDTFSGTLTIATNTVLNLGTGTSTFDTFYVGIAILTNYGTINWTSGNINCDNSPVFDNYGLWNAQGDASLLGRQPSGTATFNNFGTFRKSAGSGTNIIDAGTLFNTSGTVDVQSGAVSVYEGQGSGTMNVAAGSSISLSYYFVFRGNTLFTGTGIVGGFVVGNNGVLSGTLNCSGDTFSGTLTIATNSVLSLGTGTSTFDTFYSGIAVLTNYGTVNWTSGNINCDNNPVIYNYGLWNAQTDGSLLGRQPSGTATFNNFGTFRKSAGSGTNTIDSGNFFNTSGTLDVQSGSVSVNIGQGSGTVNVAAGSSISLNYNFTLTGNTLFTGAGTVGGFVIVNNVANNVVLSGTLNCSGDTFSGTFTIASNAVLNLGAATSTFDTYYAGTGILTNYGTINWTSGNINCDNSPVIDNYGLWNAQGDASLLGSQPNGTTTFNNFGTFRKSAGSGTNTLDARTLFKTYGTVDVQSGAVSLNFGQGSGAVNLAAGSSISLYYNFTLTGNTLFTGAGTVGGYLIANNGVFGGTLNCSGDTFSGTFTIATNAVMNLGAAAVTFDTFYAGIAILTNYGTINWTSGNINCDNSPVFDNYGLWNAQGNASLLGRQPSGTTTFNNFGTFRKSASSGTNTIDAGTLFNTTGTVDVQSGAIGFTGDRAFSTGTLKFGISGTNNFGRININGNAALAGGISANLNNLFAPAISNSFPVVTYASRTGTFGSLNLPAGLNWTNTYGPSAFALTVASVKPAQLSANSATANGNTFSFTFGTVPGQIYQIQYTTNLVPANWINLGGPVQSTNSALTISDSINRNPQLFYRAVLQQ